MHENTVNRLYCQQYELFILVLNVCVWSLMDEKIQVFSERELKFTFAICHRPSVCLSSVTFVHPTQAIEIFSNIFFALWYLGHP